MPNPKQMEKLAGVGREAPTTHALGQDDEMPSEYWQSVVDDPRADAKLKPPTLPIRTLRLSEIRQNVLRVSCNRCGRTVEIQKADAIRLAGAEAFWKEVGQRLLDNTCEQRTGRHEDDGCWPSFE